MAEGLLHRRRLEALIDGVSAIAITLLVIGIVVPVVGPGRGGSGLLEELRELWPSFLAYLLGFMAVGIWWLHHHRMFELLRGVNSRFVVLNLVFLMGIGFVPFTTGLLAEYMGEQADQRVIAVAVFTGWQFFTAMVFNVAWWYASSRGRLLRTNLDHTALRRLLRSLWITPALWLLILLLGLISAFAAVGLILALALMWLIWVPMPEVPESRSAATGDNEE
jgi:uncharacterized membrane protein